jgi:3-hydroxybutyryl-CoA dehydrogenase
VNHGSAATRSGDHRRRHYGRRHRHHFRRRRLEGARDEPVAENARRAARAHRGRPHPARRAAGPCGQREDLRQNRGPALPLKQRLFAQIETLARPDIALASNTSNFPIGEIGKRLKHRARVAGLHFFMPAHLVPLVEVVSAESTDSRVAEGLVALMKTLGKAPIWVKKDVPGFVGNRIQHAMLREALYLINDGIVDAEGVDTAVRYGFGFRFIACGPILQKEMSGWDTNYLVAGALYPQLYDSKTPAPIVKALIDKGHLGMKTKRGFWQWDDAKIAKEKARIERCLQAGMEILKSG